MCAHMYACIQAWLVEVVETRDRAKQTRGGCEVPTYTRTVLAQGLAGDLVIRDLVLAYIPMLTCYSLSKPLAL